MKYKIVKIQHKQKKPKFVQLKVDTKLDLNNTVGK